MPNGSPFPFRGVKFGKGQLSVDASASTLKVPAPPKSTTLVTFGVCPSNPLGKEISWNTEKDSTPVNVLWMGDAVPGRLVYSKRHLPSRNGEAVGFAIPVVVASLSNLATASSRAICVSSDNPDTPRPFTFIKHSNTVSIFLFEFEKGVILPFSVLSS